jgi:DNA-binding response OmpR family regulator
LLVDDDDAWSHFVEQALTDAGNTVTRVATGEAEFADFDIIIVDQVLKEANSLKVLGKISKAGLTDRVMVFASSLRVEQTMELVRFGVHDVFVKPYTVVGLADIVKS